MLFPGVRFSFRFPPSFSGGFFWRRAWFRRRGAAGCPVRGLVPTFFPIAKLFYIDRYSIQLLLCRSISEDFGPVRLLGHVFHSYVNAQRQDASPPSRPHCPFPYARLCDFGFRPKNCFFPLVSSNFAKDIPIRGYSWKTIPQSQEGSPPSTLPRGYHPLAALPPAAGELSTHT